MIDLVDIIQSMFAFGSHRLIMLMVIHASGTDQKGSTMRAGSRDLVVGGIYMLGSAERESGGLRDGTVKEYTGFMRSTLVAPGATLPNAQNGRGDVRHILEKSFLRKDCLSLPGSIWSEWKMPQKARLSEPPYFSITIDATLKKFRKMPLLRLFPSRSYHLNSETRYFPVQL